MRILYGVTGEGLGHAMRARALVEHLTARGHRVRIAASGRAARVLDAHFPGVLHIDGLCLRYDRGGLHRRRTVLANLRAAPQALARNVELALRDVAVWGPEAVVTDFDSFAHGVGRVLGLPVISFDHQHVLDRFRHPAAVRALLSPGFRSTRAFVRAKTPGCEHYVVTSFFFPELRPSCREATTVVGPVVRPAIASAASATKDGDHVLVYQTARGDERLLPALRANACARFVVYGSGREGREGNVTLRAFDEARFVEDLATSRAVISNGGFTTLAEALYLGKAALSVPIARQSEQELNAAYLERLGLGVRATRLDAPSIGAFLTRHERGELSGARDARLLTGRADAFATIDRLLGHAAAREAA
jgi:uncharacterized protein (TIGR00661 family)